MPLGERRVEGGGLHLVPPHAQLLVVARAPDTSLETAYTVVLAPHVDVELDFTRGPLAQVCGGSFFIGEGVELALTQQGDDLDPAALEVGENAAEYLRWDHTSLVPDDGAGEAVELVAEGRGVPSCDWFGDGQREQLVEGAGATFQIIGVVDGELVAGGYDSEVAAGHCLREDVGLTAPALSCDEQPAGRRQQVARERLGDRARIDVGAFTWVSHERWGVARA